MLQPQVLFCSKLDVEFRTQTIRAWRIKSYVFSLIRCGNLTPCFGTPCQVIYINPSIKTSNESVMSTIQSDKLVTFGITLIHSLFAAKEDQLFNGQVTGKEVQFTNAKTSCENEVTWFVSLANCQRIYTFNIYIVVFKKRSFN